MGEGRKEMFIWVWWPERETESTFLSNTLSVLFPLSGCPSCAEESSSVAVGTSHPSLLPFCFLQCMALPFLLSWLLLSQQGLLWQKGGHLSRPMLRREARGITAETIGCKGLTFYGGLLTRQSALPVWYGQLKDPSTSGTSSLRVLSHLGSRKGSVKIQAFRPMKQTAWQSWGSIDRPK